MDLGTKGSSRSSSAGNKRDSASLRGQKQPQRSASNSPQYAEPQGKNVLAAIFIAIGRALLAIGKGILFVFKKIGWAIGALWHKSKVASVVLAVVVVALIGFFADGMLTADKIYSGVKVGKVDVSNMTIQDAADAIEEQYSEKMFNTQVFVFSNEENARDLDIDMELLEQEALAEQISYEEAQATRKVWLADAVTLGAELPANELATAAFQVGRSNGLHNRLIAAVTGYDIPVKATYNDVMLGTMIKEIEASIGEPMEDFGITIENGVSSVKEGHDGYSVNKDDFTNRIDDFFFIEDSLNNKMIADVQYTPMRIGREEAETLSDAVTQILSGGSSFDYADASFDVDAAALGKWTTTDIVAKGDGWKLIPLIDMQTATTSLVELINTGSIGSGVNVTISQEDGQFVVQPDKEITIPSVGSALEQLDNALFSKVKDTGASDTTGAQYNIRIEPELYSGSFKLDEAMSYGLVDVFSSFTTNYNNRRSTANRTYNIHLAADLINDSLVKANGGQWSFNDTAGDCNEDNGFRAAGTILDGELQDAIGGGVCQVATTVYNAVYDSGLPIVERQNHSLYISAYPDGRDAAVAYPSLDLIWENDTPSDILLTTSYTDTSVTVNLIGVNPGYTVESVPGTWEEGDRYTIKTEVDDSLAEGKSYVETKGQNGRVIDVRRTVRDANGNILREKTFVSVYQPVNMLIKIGPGTNKADVIAQAEEEREKAEAKARKAAEAQQTQQSQKKSS